MKRELVNLIFRLCFKRLWSEVPTVSKVRKRFAIADQLSSLGRRRELPKFRLLGEIPVEWIGDDERACKGIIIFLHGGGFAVRAEKTDRRFCFDMSRRSGLSVVLVPYRLAPEHSYPQGLDDCYQVYEALISAGVDSRRILLVGHSSGANYALVILMRARQRGLPQPAGAVLLSPPTDMTAQSRSLITNADSDVMLGPNIWNWVKKIYLRDISLDHPEVSPLFGEWIGLASMSFHVSDAELLLDDTRRAVEKLALSGVRADLTIWEGLPHNFYFLDALPEYNQFHQKLLVFIERIMITQTSTAQKMASHHP